MRRAAVSLSVVLALAFAFAIPAFADDNDDDGPVTASWVAVELNGKPVEGPTLSYTTDKASGTGGCNRFTGPITMEDDAVQIGPLVSTKMLCEGKSEIETQYFTALEGARSFVIDDNTMILKDENGSVVLKFKK